jgi:hypothetical protein
MVPVQYLAGFWKSKDFEAYQMSRVALRDSIRFTVYSCSCTYCVGASLVRYFGGNELL